MEWNGEGGGPPLGISLGYYQENSWYFRQPVAPSPTPDKWNQIVVEDLLFIFHPHFMTYA